MAIFISPKQNYTAEVNCLVALHELYKYINKYYDQVSRGGRKQQAFFQPQVPAKGVEANGSPIKKTVKSFRRNLQ